MSKTQEADTTQAKFMAIDLSSWLEFYNYTKPMRVAIAKKKAKGTYDHDKAIKGFSRAIAEALKSSIATRYYPDGVPRISPATRDAVAAEMLEYYDDEISEEAERLKVNARLKRSLMAGQKYVPIKEG